MEGVASILTFYASFATQKRAVEELASSFLLAIHVAALSLNPKPKT